ncbi:hypothetical protein P170DRAFT_5940 [Aspergillus steynii IBT 23096]|uniref:Uncharacterized protein n=1 Tax=Aspergillus steynii IBT 23096 TaxID=1392250 RepID=A0A2I2GLZ5_9EURO|nr:uncharacterized protein P170DRAFT_5940 [Aspergillus steynii IBT 23096]PLB53894.1 hypothetical protein P170DRAFT_5940 [Aspergillus steynii IBT 23096]
MALPKYFSLSPFVYLFKQRQTITYRFHITIPAKFLSTPFNYSMLLHSMLHIANPPEDISWLSIAQPRSRSTVTTTTDKRQHYYIASIKDQRIASCSKTLYFNRTSQLDTTHAQQHPSIASLVSTNSPHPHPQPKARTQSRDQARALDRIRC